MRQVEAGSTPRLSPASKTTWTPCVAHLRFPKEHHKRIRHSNLIERTFGEDAEESESDRPSPGRAELPEPGMGGARPGSPKAGVALTMTPKMMRRLQDLPP